MIRAILAIAVIVAAPALAEPQTRFYDPRGNSVGTAAPQGQGSVRYFDQRGNSVGTSTTNSSGTTTFYDARGNAPAGRLRRRAVRGGEGTSRDDDR